MTSEDRAGREATGQAPEHVCPECKGVGAVDYGMAGSAGEALREACDTCGGDGKIVEPRP